MHIRVPVDWCLKTAEISLGPSLRHQLAGALGWSGDNFGTISRPGGRVPVRVPVDPYKASKWSLYGPQDGMFKPSILGGHVGLILEPCWTKFGAMLDQLWSTHLGAMLDQSWSHVGPTLEPCWALILGWHVVLQVACQGREGAVPLELCSVGASSGSIMESHFWRQPGHLQESHSTDLHI